MINCRVSPNLKITRRRIADLRIVERPPQFLAGGFVEADDQRSFAPPTSVINWSPSTSGAAAMPQFGSFVW